MTDRVLVTGATGFIAQHCIVQLLEAGYDVRGTARSESRTSEVVAILTPHLSEDAQRRLDTFNVVAADLTSDDGWRSAVDGCRYVMHVASPLPRGAVNHIVAFRHLAEHGVVVVQPRGGGHGDEELAAVGVRPGVGHGENAWRSSVGTPP